MIQFGVLPIDTLGEAVKGSHVHQMHEYLWASVALFFGALVRELARRVEHA